MFLKCILFESVLNSFKGWLEKITFKNHGCIYCQLSKTYFNFG